MTPEQRNEHWEAVMRAALNWEYTDTYPDSPAAYDPAEALAELRNATRAYRLACSAPL